MSHFPTNKLILAIFCYYLFIVYAQAWAIYARDWGFWYFWHFRKKTTPLIHTHHSRLADTISWTRSCCLPSFIASFNPLFLAQNNDGVSCLLGRQGRQGFNIIVMIQVSLLSYLAVKHKPGPE